jgi:hypothetical protein
MLYYTLLLSTMPMNSALNFYSHLLLLSTIYGLGCQGGCQKHGHLLSLRRLNPSLVSRTISSPHLPM